MPMSCLLLWSLSEQECTSIAARVTNPYGFTKRCKIFNVSLSPKAKIPLGVMQMRIMNTSATKNQKHSISIEVFPFVRMQIRMRMRSVTKWTTTCSNWSKCECFVVLEIPSIHRTVTYVTHALCRENYTGPLISFVIRFFLSYSHYT